ncbi:MFS transporter [Nonomuraea sp. NPDC046570]|uniref:MFS transporter n=1 Tax=Nonomuraea sp. NPDC046570 TaxID=3155255 RepID=UPI00340E2CD8
MTQSASRPQTLSLWRQQDFRNFWVGHTASQFAAQFTTIALPLIAVLALGAAPDDVGILRAAGQLPFFLFALFAGVLVDRWRRRNVLILADLGRAGALAVVPVAYAMHLLGMPLLYVVGFLVGVFTVFFDVAYQAYLPRLVDREQLTQGNSMLESSRSAAQIGGPALGGSLVSLVTAPVAVLASTLFFLMSALAIGRIERSEPVPEASARPGSTFGQIREGLGLVTRDAVLRTVAITAGIFNFFFTAFMTIYIVFLSRDLHLSGAMIGLCMAAFGPGFLVGALLAAKLPKRFGYGVVLVAAAAISDAVMLGVAALHDPGPVTVVLLIVINFLFGAFAQTFNVSLMAVRQAITPDHIQGRAAATIRFIGVGLAPLGALLGGFVGGEIGLRVSVLLAAVGMCLAPVFLVTSPLARVGRELPKPAAS